jgi:phage terminase small subunit
MTRERVVQELLEAIDMARQQADPGTMIAGWREIGRLCGFYAPEVKKVDIGINARRVIGKLEALSDAELLQLTQKQAGELSVTAP